MIKVGRTVELECLDTPGHTMCHICLRSHAEQPALFSGDTLFNAGAGNCHNGGHPEDLYATFVDQLAKLPDDTRVYPGPRLHREQPALHPRARAGQRRRPGAAARGDRPGPGDGPASRPWREEKRDQHLPAPAQPERDRGAARGLPGAAGATRMPKTVFLKLRELRNSW